MKACDGWVAIEEATPAVLELAHVVQRLNALNDPERGITVNVGTTLQQTRFQRRGGRQLRHG